MSIKATNISRQRDYTIDALRGIAIFIMFAANAGAYGLAEPHPFWFRVYGSLAAPLFITLTGMMVHHSILKKNCSAGYFLLRALMVLTVAVAVDVLIWRIMPFTTVDVLYLIALSAPVIYLLRKLNLITRFIVALGAFSLPPLLQHYFGYTSHPAEYDLGGNITTEASGSTSIFYHWLVDGWFPLFPWIGFAVFGSALAELRWREEIKRFSSWAFLAAGVAVFASGIILWMIFPATLITRGGYSELFYPPTITYSLCAAGAVLLLFFIADRTSSWSFYAPFQLLGESSLLMYVLHLAVIAYIIDPFIGAQPVAVFTIIYVVLSAALTGVAMVVRFYKKQEKQVPYAVKFLLGG